ncbi:Sphingosine kinase 1 [Saguinus oedipus]|uniref:Sphingosine kinase 1 n=1 Tax=Saguinus oedipus TaxID=9490 RepID=A0ABQ9V2A1_SAGOE|nr:Sphingosine kinase 1 [Saguinus oedipus]
MLTEWRNHAWELVRSAELGRSGSQVWGPADERVVNLLMDWPDWEAAVQGTSSSNHYAGYLLTNCALLLCRRLLSPLNLLSLHMALGLRLFSVLSLTWGFIADVDLESAKYRRLGEMRFTLGTFLAWQPCAPTTAGWPTSL